MISKEQIAALVTLYSQFHGAIDPFSPEVVAAEEKFYQLLHSLHSTHASDVPFPEFR